MQFVTLTAREVKGNPNQIVVAADGFLGKSEMTLPLTLGEFATGCEKRKNGELVQYAFPTLNKTQREFLITGMNMEQQAAVFGEEEEIEA
jgi:hypothetical protein